MRLVGDCFLFPGRSVCVELEYGEIFSGWYGDLMSFPCGESSDDPITATNTTASQLCIITLVVVEVMMMVMVITMTRIISLNIDYGCLHGSSCSLTSGEQHIKHGVRFFILKPKLNVLLSWGQTTRATKLSPSTTRDTYLKSLHKKFHCPSSKNEGARSWRTEPGSKLWGDLWGDHMRLSKKYLAQPLNVARPTK